MSQPLLEVDNLKIEFRIPGNTVYAVNGVSFRVNQGEVLGLVGESGCGKSVTALSIPGLIPKPYGHVVAGAIRLYTPQGEQQNLLALSAQALQHIRGNEISMIFQDPMTSLNPVLTIGYQLIEPLKQHQGMDESTARAAAIQLLERVGIPEAENRLTDYPHQFSGGMRQRVMIAMAVACRPSLLIADEPTTALDVTIQAQILDLLRELRTEFGTAVIIITHDLGVIAELADKVAVIYAGMVMESASVYTIFDAPAHPYTRALMASVPSLHYQPERLATIGGVPPNLTTPIQGCPFEPRCDVRLDRCRHETPPFVDLGGDHGSACWLSVPEIALES
ncbi:MAG: ABC transporter ATP-binding protein [Caldilineaceae bacterium]